jgi:hypothetical protein
MEKAGRWSHKNVSVPVGLDPVWESREQRVSQELAPTREVKGGLRLEIGQLNGDGHWQRYARNGKKRQYRNATKKVAIPPSALI